MPVQGIEVAFRRALQSRWAGRVAIVVVCALMVCYATKVATGWYLDIRERLREMEQRADSAEARVDERGARLDLVQDTTEDMSAAQAARVDELELRLVDVEVQLADLAGDPLRLKQALGALVRADIEARKASRPLPKTDKVSRDGVVTF